MRMALTVKVEHGTGRIINERINYAEPAKA